MGVKTKDRKVGKTEKASGVTPCILCNNGSPVTIFRKKDYDIVQCPSCRLVYLGNPPSLTELQELYSFGTDYQTQFRASESRRERNELKLATRRFAFLKKFRIKGSILDIGCSAGFFLKVARDNGWQTRGIEISDDTAAIARERYGLDVFTGTIEESDLEAKSFDVVTMWDLIEHTADPAGTMLTVNRVLKDDGLVVLSTPNIDGLFPRFSSRVAKLLNYWPHPEPPYHLFQFSKNTISRLLSKTGFEPVKIADDHYLVGYTFGKPGSVIRSPKMLLYTAVFLPVLLLGPLVHAGDVINVVARKKKHTEQAENRDEPIRN